MMGEGSWTYVLGMLATLWAACVSYLAPLDKRPHAKARVLGMLALAAAASGVSVLFQPLPIWVSLTSIFAFSILFFMVCGDMPLSGALYAAVWAQISQQLAAETFLLLYWFLSPHVDWGRWSWTGAALLMFTAAFAIVAVTVARWMPTQGKYAIGPRQLALSLVFQAIFEVLCWLLISDMGMIAAVRAMAGSEAQEKYLREAEESVGIYDAIFQTGNEVLDTVLTEKSLYCGANGIRLGCVADGKLLAFMDSVDIYAILGNALDNAIEGVQSLGDSEKRMIDVLICRERQFAVLQVVNPLEGALKFRDGLPVSTKPRDGYHGFGLKSIRHTVEQYGGFTTVNTQNGYFCLKILIPLKSK